MLDLAGLNTSKLEVYYNAQAKANDAPLVLSQPSLFFGYKHHH